MQPVKSGAQSASLRRGADVSGVLSILTRILLPVLCTTAAVASYMLHPLALAWLDLDVSEKPIRVLTGGAAYFSAAWLGGRLVGLALERAGRRRRQVPKLLLELVSAALFLAATIATVILVIGQSWSGAIAGSGLVIAVIGFALRGTLADVFAGIAVGLEAPYRIGDWVAINDRTRGRVIEIGWRTTRLFTRNDTYVILPNSQIARQTLTNYSAPNRKYRAQVEVVLSHDLSVAAARDLLTDAAARSPIIVNEPKPDVRVASYDMEGIRYHVRFWVPSFADDVDCRDAIFGQIDAALRDGGLPLPAPKLRLSSEPIIETARAREAGDT
ncbi:mechanosensitive ion channel family protein [Nitratireductor mangrovi]|uniref:Small-conductance mechanosensitive channel n=1 Tax=Nitratireductor mangrovi TaxID=2599600 RepID=A0A5B8KWX7_9HYPH|nr:mechanosensitive ion channel family protein [Nitratireductor mangrovi]